VGQVKSQAKNQTTIASAEVSDLTTEILCLVLAAAIFLITIYACAPHHGLPHLVKLGLNFIACACQILTAFYFISKNTSETSSGSLP